MSDSNRKIDKKTAIVLFNLGGPDKLESVKPFLFNLFNDKAIISLWQPFRFLLAKLISNRRAESAKKNYEILGGKSPLLDTTLKQALSLEKELSFVGNFKVFVAMRYFHPFSAEVIPGVVDYDPDEIILLPLYPQFSSATSRSSLLDFMKKLVFEIFPFKRRKLPQGINLKIICCYPEEKEFIKSHSLLVKQQLMKLYQNNIKDFRLLFSAHGLPQKLIQAGDPYVFQIEKTAAAISKNLAELLNIEESLIDSVVCYQSKVGPLAWTSPNIEQEIRRAAVDKKIPVIVPLSFVSDHIETLVELDVEYKELADSLGIKNYLRVSALNLEGHFIKSLAKLCENASANDDSGVFSGLSPMRICPKKFKFCPNTNFCQE